MSETIRSRLRKYKRRESLTVWVAAGFAGLLGVLSLDLLDPAPAWIKRIALTLVVLGAAALARARVGFEWAATTIERKLEDNKAKKSDPYPASSDWPAEHELFWDVALWAMILAGVLLVVAIWLR